MAKLDRRDRVSIAAGVLILLGVFILAAALLLMNPLTGIAGAGVAGCGAGILTGQRRLARRAAR
jgi:hypothetical protein